jgi:hypothetical protein
LWYVNPILVVWGGMLTKNCDYMEMLKKEKYR